mgnify:CR=1 FL=1|tara:strand:- start:1685 stop:2320 length:636 start_codon:yes stop_codon:yes gene_type:complete
MRSKSNRRARPIAGENRFEATVVTKDLGVTAGTPLFIKTFKTMDFPTRGSDGSTFTDTKPWSWPDGSWPDGQNNEEQRFLEMARSPLVPTPMAIDATNKLTFIGICLTATTTQSSGQKKPQQQHVPFILSGAVTVSRLKFYMLLNIAALTQTQLYSDIVKNSINHDSVADDYFIAAGTKIYLDDKVITTLERVNYNKKPRGVTIMISTKSS